jgi:hypothetical protein
MKSKAICIGCILAALFCGYRANATIIMTLEQVGSNVVGTASGRADLTDLSFLSHTSADVTIVPSIAYLALGNVPTTRD